jgi:Holliday junction resolvase RusA-like endonuclease
MQPHDPSRPRAANVIPFTTAMPDAVFDRIIETVERDFVARHCPTIVIRTLSLPPSVNSAWLNIQGRGRVKSSAYRLWERESLKAIDKLYLPAVHPEAGLVVRLELPRPDKRSDLDNRIKPILDLLVASGVIADDRHVLRLSARWVEKDKPMIVAVGAVPCGNLAAVLENEQCTALEAWRRNRGTR